MSCRGGGIGTGIEMGKEERRKGFFFKKLLLYYLNWIGGRNNVLDVYGPPSALRRQRD